MSMPLRASLVIPTYNRGDILCQAIEQALEQDYPHLEVVVVDQTASYLSNIQEGLSRLKPRIRYLTLATPNVSAARNVGVRNATGDIIVFVDDDVKIPRTLITSLIPHFAEKKVGAVMGLTLPGDEADPQSVLREAAEIFYARPDLALGEVAPVKWLSSCCALYSRKALEEAGLFDDYLKSWCEDADASLRLRDRGYTLLLDTRVRPVHLHWNQGGCEIRNPQFMDKTELSRLKFLSYFLFKDKRMIGFWGITKTLFRAYRDFLFNRRILSRGLRFVWRRHGEFAGAILEASRAVRSRSLAKGSA